MLKKKNVLSNDSGKIENITNISSLIDQHIEVLSEYLKVFFFSFGFFQTGFLCVALAVLELTL